MNIEQWKARFQNKRVKEILSPELLRASEEQQQRVQALIGLAKSEYWKILKDSFTHDIELYKNMLTRMDPRDSLGIIQIQEKIRAIEELLSLVEGAVNLQ